MSQTPSEQRISRISTNWDAMLAAHGKEGYADEDSRARGEILKRYAGCAYNYIFGAIKDHHVAEDLTQEFALRFVRGDYRNASPSRGRFRDYLKTSLRNLITDHFRAKSSEESVSFGAISWNDSFHRDTLETDFATQWRQRVLSIGWGALKEHQERNSNRYFSILHLRAANPDASSEALAELYNTLHQKVVSAEWVRQNLRRARKKFGEFLVEEVVRTIGSPDKDDIKEELALLKLQQYIDI